MVESGLLASSLGDVTQIAADVTTIVAALIVGAWAYVRSYGQQIARPAVELTVDGKVIGEVASRSLIHVTFSVRNAGSRECRVFLCWKLTSLDSRLTSLTDVKYRDRRTDNDVILTGQVKFTREVPMRLQSAKISDDQQQPSAGLVAREAQPLVTQLGATPEGFEPILPYTTFVAPGVTQRYDFVTSVPGGSAAAAVIGYIQYQRSRSRTETILGGPVRAIVGLSSGETKVTTSDHTAVGVVVMAPK